MDDHVRLRRLDDALLEELADVAGADADPDEVMPPIDAPLPWGPAHREAFLAFHRSRRDEVGEITYAVCVDGAVAGAIRLVKGAEPDVWETGLWVGRGYRGRGVGAAACALVAAEARALGAEALVADTTQGNRPARALLARMDAQTGTGADGEITARIGLGRP